MFATFVITVEFEGIGTAGEERRMRRKCKPGAVGETAQRRFAFAAAADEDKERAGAAGDDTRFVDESPHPIFLAHERLDIYLQVNGLGWVIRLRQELEELDLSLLTQAYSSEGRKAIHPRVMLGLIIFGMLKRQWSLRELQELARRDLAAWWICGGLQPDHSTIGKFIQLHAEVLSEAFFTDLVRQVVTKLRLKPATIGGDGTIIEAAGAKLRRLKLEAAKEAAAQAGGDAEDNARAVEALATRMEEDRERGRSDGKVSLCTTEPTAVVQPCKDGRVRAAYKPSIWVHAAGFIIGQYVHPCSEPAAIEPLLDQHRQVFEQDPPSLLLDAGYNGIETIGRLLSANIDALIPGGKVLDGNWEKPSAKASFAKIGFRYNEAADLYHCPEGKTLRPAERGKARGSRPAFRVYRSQDCQVCAVRAQCTKSRRGRTIHRYEGEELREAMAQVLAQPRARAKYRQRGLIVEPPFAELKHRQGLMRFHRRGQRGVRVEFALHCIAFNLKKALHAAPRFVFVLSMLAYLPHGGCGCIPLAIITISDSRCP